MLPNWCCPRLASSFSPPLSKFIVTLAALHHIQIEPKASAAASVQFRHHHHHHCQDSPSKLTPLHRSTTHQQAQPKGSNWPQTARRWPRSGQRSQPARQAIDSLTSTLTEESTAKDLKKVEVAQPLTPHTHPLARHTWQ